MTPAAFESTEATKPIDPEPAVVPGEVLHDEGEVTLLTGRDVISLQVVNTGDRPIQVGSHYHLAEANPALSLDRVAARGRRLAIPSGTAVRFEPGIPQTVEAVALAGRRVIAGLRGAVAGPLAEADDATGDMEA